MENNHLIIFVYSMAGGGAEKVALLLANELVCRQFKVDLVLIEEKGSYLSLIDKRVNIFELNHKLIRYSKICKFTLVLFRIFCFRSVIQKLSAAPILSVGEWPNLIAPLAIKIFRLKRNIIISEHSTRTFINTPELYQMGLFFKWLSRKAYLNANHIICISNAVKVSVLKAIPQMMGRFTVIHNPINYGEIQELIKEDIREPWLTNKNIPVLIALGRLQIPKDYHTMLKAVAVVNIKRYIHLIVLGEGPLRSELEALCETLNIESTVKFKGFQINPYKYLSKADLFVHSALYEGFGNVFIEALACGLPIVTTDCNTPNEIMTQDVMGMIVPTGDYIALAKAIEVALDIEYDQALLKKRARDFDISKITDQYITVSRKSSAEHS